VAGTTGHGKTTTLLAAVGELDAVAQHIVTLEDPVEYRLPHVTQVPVVSDGPGVTFAQGLRAVLRQDPDVIVVGEMRDPETVAIALQAALSGHLVLSSIHAIDAVATCFRLLERGVEPYLLAAALTGVIAQRLVRRVCPACAVPQPVPPAEQAFLARWAPGRPVPATLPRGRGCNRCQNTGYQGRECLAEILPVTEAVRAAIAAGADAAALQAAATAAGLVPLAAAAADKVLAGRTTVAEAWRVLAATEEAAS
jgi:general secretion pathway protein E